MLVRTGQLDIHEAAKVGERFGVATEHIYRVLGTMSLSFSCSCLVQRVTVA